MKEVTATGKTVQEAIDKALAELKLPREQAEVNVLELPSRGILGLMGKDAMVRVKALFDPVDFADHWLEKFLNKSGLPGRVRVTQSEGVVIAEIAGGRAGPLIGRHGQTLNALQYMLTLALNRNTEEYIPVSLDIGGYRKKRNQSVERIAKQAARKVLRTGEKVVLSPMSASERRIVHLALSEYSEINTYSIGEEPHRKVVVEKT